MKQAPAFWQKDGALARLLSPLGRIYDAGVGRRLAGGEGYRADVPVLCVGNLVLGGAGKTPSAMALAARLQALGRVPHLLSKGYGGAVRETLRVDPAQHDAALVGDEPLLLARIAPVWVGPDRAALARAACAAGADCLILDDGFQDPSLHKTATLLVFDGGFGVGNARVVPAGPLRERPERGFARADACLVIGPDETGLAAHLPGDKPCFTGRLQPPADLNLKGRPVFAFAGIGRPEKFFASLREMGADIRGQRQFPDHHPFSPAELEALSAAAAQAKATLMTTEKDAMRLSPDWRTRVTALPVALQFDDEAGIDRWLLAVLDRVG